MALKNYILIALIVCSFMTEGLARTYTLYSCVKQQGKATVKIRTKGDGDVETMVITGRARPGDSIEFDSFIIDRSKKCKELIGNFWNEDKLESDPYGSGQYDANSERVKWRVHDGNGYVAQNKNRSLLYMQGETVVACGKLKKNNKRCKYTTDMPTTTPVAEVSDVPSVTPTVAPSVAPTTVPIDVPSIAPTVVPSVAPTVASTVAPSPTVTPTVAPTIAPTHMTEEVCTEVNSQPSNYEEKACNEVIFPSRASTIPDVPSSWQKTNCFANLSAEAAYDLALVGAGIGSAYVSNELRFGHAHNHTITVFEAGDNVGGRLLSAFQGGALGIPVRPFNIETNVAPPEYGGMRIATKYPLVFNQAILLWEKYFKNDENQLCSLKFCTSPDDPYKCCEGLLTPMNVGNVAYFNRKTALGATLGNSSLKDSNPLYDGFNETYTVAHIDNYKNYSAFVNCILLAVGVKNYTGIVTESGNVPATQGFKEACNPTSCKKVSDTFCMLCREFPEPAAAAVSCSGYDTDPNLLSTNDVVGLMDEVVNIEGKTFLYLLTVGYQRLVQELFSGTMSGNVTKGDGPNQYHTLDIAPQFRKKLIAVGVGEGNFNNAVERARVLAKKQVEKYHGKATNTDIEGPYNPIRLKFEDGSVTTSHMAYMTMLPYDTVNVKGLEPWHNVIHNSTGFPTSLVKAVLAWDTFSLADELKLKPCVVIKNGEAGGGPCDRIILDGNFTKPNTQVVRQAWLWDYKQILLYQIGYEGTPSQNGIGLATKSGTEAFVKKAVEELQMAVSQYGIVIPPPSWFRIKSWPIGSVLFNWGVNVTDPAQLSEHFRRPFGNNVKVWYGNSEMAKDGNLHGWAEGALSMANTSLPELKTELSMLKAANQQKS